MRHCQIVYTDPYLDRQLISEILADGYKLKTITISDLFRAQLKIENEMTKHIKSYMDNGHVIPVQLTDKLIEIEIDKTDKNVLILDYPKSIQQFESLGRLMALKGLSIEIVWYFRHYNFNTFVRDYYENENQKWIDKHGDEVREKWFIGVTKMMDQIELLKSNASYLWTEIALTHINFRDSIHIKEQIIKTAPNKMFAQWWGSV